jgi:hypothetical protein
MGIKNLWALNVDELLVSDQLKYHLKKTEYEVCFPLNAQMKNIDLILLDLKTNRAKTIQVKGSRTYEPQKAEVKRNGDGSAAWFRIEKEAIFNSSNKVDYYIFVLHNFIDGPVKKEIKIDYLIMPIHDFHKYCNKKTARKGGFYHFIIWVDPKGKRSFDIREDKENPIALSKYLNNWELLT